MMPYMKSSSPTARMPPIISMAPSPTVGNNTVRVQLAPYGLQYTVTENRIPFRSEYLEVVAVTRMYLEGYFKDQYSNSGLTMLYGFITVFTSNSFTFGQPILIDYQSTALFDSESAVIPTASAIDQMLSSAFQGENLNGFIGMLQSLPPGNVFSTTIFVNKTEVGQATVFPKSSKRFAGTATTASVAAFAGVFILAAGFLVHQRRRNNKERMEQLTFRKPAAGGTVSDETYLGGWSLDPSLEVQPFQRSSDKRRRSVT